MILTKIGKRRIDNLNVYIKFATKVILFLIFLNALFSVSEKLKTYFPIKAVKIFGASHLNQDAVQQTLFPLVNKNFFAVDIEQIKDRLFQSPWVAQATVKRVWPDQILITVTEKTPIARWNHLGLLSQNGEIFTPDIKSYPSNIPLFVGPEGQQLQMLQYYTKINQLFSALHFKISRLEMTPQVAWSLTFDNGMKLTVGHKDVLTRMSHFVKVYHKIIGNRVADVEYVDLRYHNGLAVRWKTVT